MPLWHLTVVIKGVSFAIHLWRMEINSYTLTKNRQRSDTIKNRKSTRQYLIQTLLI